MKIVRDVILVVCAVITAASLVLIAYRIESVAVFGARLSGADAERTILDRLKKQQRP